MEKNKEAKEGLSEQEKKILIGESTFLSFGFVITIILAVVFTVRIDGKANVNAQAVNDIIQKQNSFENKFMDKMDTVANELKKLNTRLSRIEGKLDTRGR